jgi:hypothetical protein
MYSLGFTKLLAGVLCTSENRLRGWIFANRTSCQIMIATSKVVLLLPLRNCQAFSLMRSILDDRPSRPRELGCLGASDSRFIKLENVCCQVSGSRIVFLFPRLTSYKGSRSSRRFL